MSTTTVHVNEKNTEEVSTIEGWFAKDWNKSDWFARAKKTFQTQGKKVVITFVLGGTALMLVLGSGLVINAVILGGVTMTGLVLLYYRMPKAVQQFIQRWNIVLDIAVGILTYFILGHTATAVLAAGLVSIMTSAGLMFLTEERGPTLVPAKVIKKVSSKRRTESKK